MMGVVVETKTVTALGREVWGLSGEGQERTFWNDGHALCRDRHLGYTGLHTCQNTLSL